MRLRPARPLLHVFTLFGALAGSMLGVDAAAAPLFSRLDPTSAARFAPARALTPGASLLGVAPDPAPEVSFLAVDGAAVAEFRAAGGGRLAIPEADGGSVELELEPYALFADGVRPSFTDDQGRHAFDPDVSLFRGRIAGEDGSWAVVALSGAGVYGTVERSAGRAARTGSARMRSRPRAGSRARRRGSSAASTPATSWSTASGSTWAPRPTAGWPSRTPRSSTARASCSTWPWTATTR
jgi:hypothetical protein